MFTKYTGHLVSTSHFMHLVSYHKLHQPLEKKLIIMQYPLFSHFFFRLANKTTLKKLLGYSNSLLKIAHCFVATCQQLPI